MNPKLREALKSPELTLVTVAVGSDLVVSTGNAGRLVAVVTSEASLRRAQGLGVAGHVIAFLGIHPAALHLLQQHVVVG